MAGRTSGAERDVRRILAEAGVAAIDDLRGQVAALEARLAEVERERDEARAACSEACTEAGNLTAALEQERTLSSHLQERATAAEARVRELEERIAALEAQLTTRGACECGADDVCALARRAQEAEVRADEQAAELHRLLKALTGLVTEIEALIAESHGVAGLHLNGDVATWDELEPGGRFERLASLADARAAIAALDGEVGNG